MLNQIKCYIQLGLAICAYSLVGDKCNIDQSAAMNSKDNHSLLSLVRDSSLVVCSTNPFVDNVQHVLSSEGCCEDKGDKSDHGQAAVDHFSFISKSSLESRQVSERRVVASGCLLVVRMVGVKEERVTESRGQDGRRQRDGKEMSICGKHNRALHRDSGSSGNGGQSSPLLQVKKGIGIGNVSVAMGMCSAANKEPSEHGMATVPLLSMDRRTPSPLCQGSELSFPAFDGVIINLRLDEVQTAAWESKQVRSG